MFVTSMALKLRKVWNEITYFSSSSLLIFTKVFLKKDMNNFLDIPKTDMAQLYDIPVSNSYGWGSWFFRYSYNQVTYF